MTIINLKSGDIVYGISSNRIKEYVVLGISQDGRIRSKDPNSNYVRENTYGDNCFLSKKKAEKVLKDKLQREKLEIRKLSTVPICDACSAPVDHLGFCRCS